MSSTTERRFASITLNRFSDVPLDEFVHGVYAIDPALRAQRDEINEFPPYEFALDEGREIAQTPFADGATLIECLGRDAAARHPYFDEAGGEVVTLSMAVNRCRKKHGADRLSYQKQPLATVLAYLNFEARGTRLAVTSPESAAAKAAYAAGRAFFYTKHGQLNLSCADCHVTSAGRHLREQTLAPLLGAVNHYPVYGLNWGALGTLQQRFGGCLEQVRAASLRLESTTYRQLEYFLALMSDGLPLVGPSTQR